MVRHDVQSIARSASAASACSTSGGSGPPGGERAEAVKASVATCQTPFVTRTGSRFCEVTSEVTNPLGDRRRMDKPDVVSIVITAAPCSAGADPDFESVVLYPEDP